MKGSNEIHLNLSTITQIVQYYFDQVLFKEDARVKVSSVVLNKGGYTETVIVTTIDEAPDA